MSEKKTVLTYDGLKRIEDELQELKIVRRKDVAEKIKEARGQGDLSENAEYDSAKEEQAEIEARIVQLEKMLRNVEVIDEDEVDTNVINVGCRVKVLHLDFNEEAEYSIVGSAEADPAEQKISNESPLGKALLGHKIEETVEFEAPNGILQVKILDITKL